MKKLIFIPLLIFQSLAFGQQINSKQPLTRVDYLKKSKNQNTAAWVLLAGGFTILTITGISISNNLDFTGTKDYTSSEVATGLSVAMVIGSIPLFIASGKNKRKSFILSFKNERMHQISKTGLVYQAVPSLNLKIGL